MNVKIILPILIIIIGITGVSYLFANTAKPGQVLNTTIEPSPSPSIAPSPTSPASERALKVAAFMYFYANADEKKKIMDAYGEGADDPSIAVRNLSLFLDHNPEKLALFETGMEDYLRRSKTQNTAPNSDTSDRLDDLESEWRFECLRQGKLYVDGTCR